MIKIKDGEYKKDYSNVMIDEFKSLIFDSHKKCVSDIQNFFALLGVNYEDFGYLYNTDIVIDFESNSNVLGFYEYDNIANKGYISIMHMYLKKLIESTKRVIYSRVLDNLTSTLIHESLHYNRDTILRNTDNKPEVLMGFEEVINETITQMVMYHRKLNKIDLDGFYNYMIKNNQDKRELCVMSYLIKKYGLDFVKWYVLPSKTYIDKPKEYFKDNYDELIFNINRLFINTYNELDENDDIYYETMNILKHKLK